MSKIRRWAVRFVVAVLTVTIPIAWTGDAQAAPRPPDPTNLVQVAKAYKCDLIGSPGPDYRPPGQFAVSWLVDLSRQNPMFRVYNPAIWGWEPPPWIRARLLGGCARPADWFTRHSR